MSDPIPATDVVEADGRLVVIVDGPPAWVTEAMKACDRCMDSGYVADHSSWCDRQCGGKCGGLGIKRCDCLDGQRVIEIVHEGMVCYGDPPYRHGAGWGWRKRRVVVTDVLPIERDSPPPGYRRVVLRDDRKQVLLDGRRFSVPREFPPGAGPGRYAVICELVDP